MLNLPLLLFLALCIVVSTVDADADGDNSICGKARDKGNSECGSAGGKRFYYDSVTKHCQPFLYEGCSGNGNKFESLAECREKCGNFVPKEAGGHEGHGMVLPVPKCEGNVRAAVDPEARVINCPGDQCPSGYGCNDGKCCPSSKDIVCNIEYDTGRYATQGSHTPRFFYKKEVDNCLLFTYYGALGNANNFETYNDCINYCKKK